MRILRATAEEKYLLMRNGSVHWSMLLLGLLLGLSFCMLLRAGYAQNNGAEEYDELNLEDAISREKELAADVLALEGLLAESLERSEAASHELFMARQALRELEMSAGAVALEGPGVSVLINEKEFAVYSQKIQDVDLLMLINELTAAGAEAVSVNGERIGPLSEVRLAGSNININDRALHSPYTIDAIGDPEVLSGALRLYGGIVDSLDVKANVTVSESKSVIIPAARVLKNMDIAKPAREER